MKNILTALKKIDIEVWGCVVLPIVIFLALWGLYLACR